MAPDYRSDKSETLEGGGRARRAWDAYARTVRRYGMPIVDPALQKVLRSWSLAQASDLLGFWMVWHLHGGFEGLEELGMHRTTIFRKINRFRTAFHQHPDEFTLPGVTIDAAAYWKAASKKTRG